jgi:class 3 adenylate cyclase/tetratricopeptide (TPR) repeat protein
MKCPACHNENLLINKFCSHCGASLPQECTACGFANNPTSRFCGDCGSPLSKSEEAARPNEIREEAVPRALAERRHLTIMFCDLVGSTDLSVKLDPEDLRNVINQYQRTCKEVIKLNHGFVARYMGDGLLTYFGYPTATEYDAERAVRTGLDIIQKVKSLHPHGNLQLQTRVGIASGVVVVGDIVGEGTASREETVVGETPNLAARLQAFAKPDQVVISSRTQRLVGGLFKYQDMGLYQPKGFDQPLQVYSVTGESVVESRFEATHNFNEMISLVGRQAEHEALKKAWEKAANGSGQLVMISGEPGIGKSRLVEGFREQIEPGTATTMRMFASPHATATAFHAVAEHYKRIMDIQFSDEDEIHREKLKAWLKERDDDDLLHYQLFRDFISIPPEDDTQLVSLSPPEQKFRTLTLVVQQIEAEARKRPKIIIMEDLHWLDASSLELLDLLIYRAKTLPMLIVLTFRPEFNPPWMGESHSTSIVINRLTADAALSIIQEVVGGKQLPNEIIKHIISHADGVPLFIEELTKSIIEGPLLAEGTNGYVLTRKFHPGSIPETLQDSFMARLDRMAPVKEVAQIGSTLGREFRLDLLKAVAGISESVLYDALNKLIEANIISRKGSGSHISYLFKHALMQETAYNALLKSTRKQLHARIAETLRNEFPTHVEDQPELLAHHFTSAGLFDEGFHFWEVASMLALRQFGHKEVCANLERGLAIAEKITDTERHRAMEFGMRSLLGSALMVMKGPGHHDVGAAYQGAFDFTVRNKALPKIFPVKFGLCRYHWAAGKLDEALSMAYTMERELPADHEPHELMAVHVMQGVSLWHRGEAEKALHNLEKVTQLYQLERDAPMFFTYMMDFGVFGNFYKSLALASLGKLTHSRAAARTALEIAKTLNNPHEIGFGLLANFITALMCDQLEDAVATAEECIGFSQEMGFPEFVALAKVCRESARVRNGNCDGVEEMAAALRDWDSTGFNAWQPWLRGLLAEAYLLAGNRNQAETELEKARNMMQEQHEHQAMSLLDDVAMRMTA